MKWTTAEIAAATEGTLIGPDVAIEGVSTDSRTITTGDVFVAITGERFDGHDFCAPAIAAGAGAVLVAKGRSRHEPRIEVNDPQVALLNLGVAARDRLDVPVIAITGSTGKTSTKDLLAAAMGPGAWASPASFNNEIGVPLTVLATPDDATALVVEVGSRGLGHIASLMDAVRPDVSVITNLGLVHLETFGTIDDLAIAKGELVEALAEDGTAVLPYGEERLGWKGREVRFGDDPRADVSVSNVVLDADGRATFTLTIDGQEYPAALQMAGAHQPLNAAAAVAAAVAAGRTAPMAVAGLADAVGSPWRMEVHRGRFVVVNDAYNANPTSMESALRTTAQLAERRVAVLGVMAELGPVAESEHRRIGALAAELGFAPVIVVGDTPGLAEGAGDAAIEVADAAAANTAALEAVDDGCVVLVKGSRVAGLEAVAYRLSEEAEA